VHEPNGEKSDDSKDSFYEELEQGFDNFPKYHMKMEDFNAKVGKENFFKPTNGNESLHQDSKDNGVIIVNFATSKKLVLNTPGPLLMGRLTTKFDDILMGRR